MVLFPHSDPVLGRGGGTFSPFHFVSRQLPNLFLHIWDQEQFAATVYADDYGGWYVSCVLPVWSDNAVIVVGTQESDQVSPSDLRRSHIHLPHSHISFSKHNPAYIYVAQNMKHINMLQHI